MKWLLICMIIFQGCVHAVPVASYAELHAKAPRTVNAFTADVAFDASLPSLRVRSQASLAVRSPRDLRVDIRGAGGSIAYRWIARGNAWQLWDVAANRSWDSTQGDVLPPDSPLTALTWVVPMIGVLTGELHPHSNAVFQSTEGIYRGTWTTGMHRWQVDWDVNYGMVVGIRIESDNQHWQVEVRERHDNGVAKRLEIETAHGDVKNKVALQTARVRPRDDLTDATFVLAPND